MNWNVRTKKSAKSLIQETSMYKINFQETQTTSVKIQNTLDIPY